MTHKLTEYHFQKFKGYCWKWIRKLGLTNYGYSIGFSKEKTKANAVCNINLGAAHIDITLYNDWGDIDIPTDEALECTAMHEVTHVLLARLRLNGDTRFIMEDEIQEAEHEIVRRLENVFFN